MTNEWEVFKQERQGGVEIYIKCTIHTYVKCHNLRVKYAKNIHNEK